MLLQSEIVRKLQTAFEPQQVDILAEVLAMSYENLVKTSDFSELKAAVQEVVAVQKEVAVALRATAAEVQKLATSQQKTEEELGKLAVSQQKTEEEVRKLAIGLGDARSEVGGISLSIGYALENEAYRALPAFLLDRYGIQMTERLIRTSVGDEEINFFGHAERNGKRLIVVGESKQRLDERRRGRREETIFAMLERKVEAVRRGHPGIDVVRLLITHFARPAILSDAKEKGVIVVQSFEW